MTTPDEIITEPNWRMVGIKEENGLHSEAQFFARKGVIGSKGVKGSKKDRRDDKDNREEKDVWEYYYWPRRRHIAKEHYSKESGNSPSAANTTADTLTEALPTSTLTTLA